MDSNTDDIHPIFDKILDRTSKERLKQFTGRDSAFEPPSDDCPADLVIDTENLSADTAAGRLYQAVEPRIQVNHTLTA